MYGSVSSMASSKSDVTTRSVLADRFELERNDSSGYLGISLAQNDFNASAQQIAHRFPAAKQGRV